MQVGGESVFAGATAGKGNANRVPKPPDHSGRASQRGLRSAFQVCGRRQECSAGQGATRLRAPERSDAQGTVRGESNMLVSSGLPVLRVPRNGAIHRRHGRFSGGARIDLRIVTIAPRARLRQPAGPFVGGACRNLAAFRRNEDIWSRPRHVRSRRRTGKGVQSESAIPREGA